MLERMSGEMEEVGVCGLGSTLSTNQRRSNRIGDRG